MIRRVNILVSGRVQGVYFRLFTQNKARQLGVLGNVKNLADGRVEILAEADEAVIEKFIKWCHKGPITARVDRVEVTDINTYPDFVGFEIL